MPSRVLDKRRGIGGWWCCCLILSLPKEGEVAGQRVAFLLLLFILVLLLAI